MNWRKSNPSLRRIGRCLIGLATLPIVITVTAGGAKGELPVRMRVRWLAVDTNECCAVGDVNRDGKLDVVAGRNWFAAPDFLPRPVRAIGEFGKDYSENNGDHLYDINGDGWLDVVAGSFLPTKVYWYENPGDEGLTFGKLWKEHLLVDTKFSTNERSWLRDIDSDGTPDFMVNGWSPEVRMAYWRIQSGESPSAEGVVIGPANGHGQGYGDVNGDGREDVLFGRGWYERPADSRQPNWVLHRDFELPHASCPILVRDLDQDGRNDLVWGDGHNYGLYYFRQLEPRDEKTMWEEHVIDKEWSQAHALAWADLDGDGDEELVTGKRVRAHSGGDPGASEPPAIYAYEWVGHEKRFSRHLLVRGVGTGLQIRVADMNGDGRVDLIMAGKEGTKILYNEPKSP